MDDIMELDIDAIMEGTETTLDIIFDEEQALEAEAEATTISDDIDDSTIDSIIGYDDLITDQDIDDIDNGKTPSGGDPIDVDAEDGMDDPEIFRLQKDIFQNSLLTDNDIKDLNEGMRLEEFTAKVIKEAEEINTPNLNTIQSSECSECGCNPCICEKHVEHDDDEDKFDLGDVYKSYDMKEIVKSDDDDEDDDDDFDDDDYEDDDDDDKDFDNNIFDDEVNAPSFTPAGPVQPLNDGKESSSEFELGGNTQMEDKEMLKDAFEEGYNAALNDVIEEAEKEEAEESLSEAMEDLEDIDMDMLDEAEELEDDFDSFDESAEDDSFDESSVEDTDDLDSIDEALEDIEIFNKFEGSGINDDDYNANDDLFTGWKDNKDEKGLSRYEDQNTLPFDHVSSGSFDNMDKDPSIDDMLK